MRSLAFLAALVAAATVPTVARAAAPGDCGAIPRPAAAEARTLARKGPYAAGLKAFLAGRDAAAAKVLEAAWGKVRSDLAASFGAAACDDKRLRAALARTVFASPPRALPGEDRFLPPRPVALAVAAGRCAAGDPAGAAAWLLDTTAPDDAPARAAAVCLLVAAGRPDAARAAMPPDARGPAWDAARQALSPAPADGPAAGAAPDVPKEGVP